MTPLAGLLSLTALVVTLGYIGVCVASPFGPCRWCRPAHRHTCRACHGTGLRARLAWRLWRHIRELHRDTH
ncbi:hypothetical protein GCM10009799_03070 [Nocardiopsis rhodophaea]|uniref:Uncharacterized protein n=1 Tax=Nocardiopsis rhodophaea TaxID=280238 RepID=A0ABP5DL04_9ACTN